VGVVRARRHISPWPVFARLWRARPPPAQGLERSLWLRWWRTRSRSLLGVGSRPLGVELPVRPSRTLEETPARYGGRLSLGRPKICGKMIIARDPSATDPHPFSMMAVPANIMSVPARSAPITMHVPANRCTSREPHAEQTKRRDLAKQIKGISATFRSASNGITPQTLASLIQAKCASAVDALALQIGDREQGRVHVCHIPKRNYLIFMRDRNILQRRGRHRILTGWTQSLPPLLRESGGSLRGVHI